MITMLLPVAVMIIGVLMYALSVNPKIQTMGIIAFAVGLFFTVAVFTGKTVGA